MDRNSYMDVQRLLSEIDNYSTQAENMAKAIGEWERTTEKSAKLYVYTNEAKYETVLDRMMAREIMCKILKSYNTHIREKQEKLNKLIDSKIVEKN